jgi:hypothetical protein
MVRVKAGLNSASPLPQSPPSNFNARQDWTREIVNTLEGLHIFWGDTKETKLATVSCAR